MKSLQITNYINVTFGGIDNGFMEVPYDISDEANFWKLEVNNVKF